MGNAEKRQRHAEKHPEDDRPPQRLGLPGRKPLARVEPHVAIPERNELGERNVLERRPAEMTCPRRRHDEDRMAGRGQTPAVVDILEPCRRESLVERPDLGEDFPAQQQRRRGRLFDRLRMRQFELDRKSVV